MTAEHMFAGGVPAARRLTLVVQRYQSVCPRHAACLAPCGGLCALLAWGATEETPSHVGLHSATVS